MSSAEYDSDSDLSVTSDESLSVSSDESTNQGSNMDFKGKILKNYNIISEFFFNNNGDSCLGVIVVFI